MTCFVTLALKLFVEPVSIGPKRKEDKSVVLVRRENKCEQHRSEVDIALQLVARTRGTSPGSVAPRQRDLNDNRGARCLGARIR